jgi:predicted RNA-binding protein YlxR (DUF448 family)/ribosomal protein L30E
MAAAPAAPTVDGEREPDGPHRRCIATQTVHPKEALVRFVVAPDGSIVPDVAGRLPGRGLWLTARRDIVALAVAKRLFARAARAPVTVEDGLPDRVEALLAQRCGELLGLARRAGQAVAGFVKVEAALASGDAAVLIAAADGAADGRRKLRALAPALPLADCLTSAELGAAFGREHAVHAVVMRGRLAGSFLTEAARLSGFRGGGPERRNSDAAAPRPMESGGTGSR